MIDNREMALFANSLWENYIKFRHKEANLDTVSYYKAEITAKPGNGKLSIKRPFDTQAVDVPYPSYMDDAPIGTQVLVLRFGDGNNLQNHFIIDNAERTMLASAIATGSSIAFPISIQNGGTGGTSLSAAKTNLEIPSASTDTPNMDGIGSAGSLSTFARGDHTHPSDSTKADVSSTVTNVSYDSSTNKIQKTINGSTTDVTPVVTSVNGQSGAVTVASQDTTYSISMSGNVITLTGSDSTTSSVILPVWNGSYTAVNNS